MLYAQKITKPEPLYAYKRHAYKKNMHIKQFCNFAEASRYRCRLCT